MKMRKRRFESIDALLLLRFLPSFYNSIYNYSASPTSTFSDGTTSITAMLINGPCPVKSWIINIRLLLILLLIYFHINFIEEFKSSCRIMIIILKCSF